MPAPPGISAVTSYAKTFSARSKIGWRAMNNPMHPSLGRETYEFRGLRVFSGVSQFCDTIIIGRYISMIYRNSNNPPSEARVVPRSAFRDPTGVPRSARLTGLQLAAYG